LPVVEGIMARRGVSKRDTEDRKSRKRRTLRSIEEKEWKHELRHTDGAMWEEDAPGAGDEASGDQAEHR
jgi:hypothetical protein